MRFFAEINKSGECPICSSNKDGRVILVPKPGTQKGNIAEAHQIHENCAYLVARTLAAAIVNDEG